MLSELIGLAALMGGAVAWLEAMRARERALGVARRVCQRDGVQLLDETVGLSGLRLRRSAGPPQLQRRYSFEVSLSGNDRHRGELWLAGDRLIAITTPWREVMPEVVDFGADAAARRSLPPRGRPT